VRGRLGIAPWGNALLYVTGGLIYGGENVSSSQTVRFSSFVLPFLIGPSIQTSTESNSTTRTGGTVGVGLEYLFTPNLSGKIEGLWYDMGHEDLPISNVEALHFNFQGAILRAGLNYHFNWGGGPPVETRD
jgi:outer membrane immunogenic protein